VAGQPPSARSAESQGQRPSRAVLSMEQQTRERTGKRATEGAASAPGPGDMSLRSPVLRVTVKEGLVCCFRLRVGQRSQA
jgi:hypothetical protein